MFPLLQVKNFKEYIELYTKGKLDDNDQPLKVVTEVVNDRWEVALTLSEKGFQQMSFVNSIATTKVKIKQILHCSILVQAYIAQEKRSNEKFL